MDESVFTDVQIEFEENLRLPCLENETDIVRGKAKNFVDETEYFEDLRDVDLQYGDRLRSEDGGFSSETRHDSGAEEAGADNHIEEDPEMELYEHGDGADNHTGEDPELELDEDGDELEDVVGRYEYEIEQGVATFVDERFKDRHTIPDSSADEEDEIVLKKRRMKGDKLALGSTFYSGYEFKEAVLEYALSKSRNIKQSRWDKFKLSFSCGIKGKCKWRVYCSYDKPREKWVLKTRYGYHSCTPNGRCRLLKSPVIARLFLDKLRQKQDLMPAEIQDLIQENWKITSTRNQCQRGRLLALKWLEKEYAEQFAHLRGYVQEIKWKNPGSTAIVETTSNAAREDVFSRFYVCFASLKKTWMGSCRPIIGLDGTFLKVAVKGVLLTAVGHDANNQIYPIAWAVVQSETCDAWLWFLKLLKIDLNLQTGKGFVIISDRSKGLISSVKAELPMCEHRMCVKHIVENLKKNHAKKELLKPMVWNLAWSYTPTEFEENRKKLLDYNTSLYEDVMKQEPKTWSLAFYKLGSFCEDIDNNSTESFNSTITKARGKAMVPMLETIRRQAMERISKRQKKSRHWEGKTTKYVAKMLASQKDDTDKCKVFPATHGVFEVTFAGNAYDVKTRQHTCSCGKWQITGIPCEHAYAAMIYGDLDVDDYVSPWFYKELWELNYEENMNPLRGPRFWMKRGYRLIVAPPEPEQPGRKKKKKKKFPRIKGKHESPKKRKREVEKMPRKGRIIHCSKCGGEGHNAAGCEKHQRKKKKLAQEAAASQVPTSVQGPEIITLTQPTQLDE